MQIQNLLLPELGICTEETLYFHREDTREREVDYSDEGKTLTFHKYGKCFFGTYYNALSIEKWKKYTTIGDVSLHIILKGCFEVTLLNVRLAGEGLNRIIIDRKTLNSPEKQEFALPFHLYEYKGILAFELRAVKEDSVYYGGYYDAEVDARNLRDVKLAVNICTYKREPYIRRNLDHLRESMMDNRASALYGNLKIYISDNGNTLPHDITGGSDAIKITDNKNVGGAGGFTRGLIEILKDKNAFDATHVLMMDDDVVVSSEALFRTYTLLRCRREEYKNMFVGGAMLRTDRPGIQAEAGASWNEGNLVSNKAGLDLTCIQNCLLNEIEEYTEYNAWWYCCMPMELISESNLPLPIFIRGDDLEYGLRNRTQIVLLNGVCVWHEPFENKYSSYLQYYIMRNLLYDNALHFPEYKLSSFLYRLYTTTAREMIYYRYKNIDLLFRGVRDFYGGIDFLKRTDGETLHQEILRAGYSAVPVEKIENAAFRLPSYQKSLKQADKGIVKGFRYLTVNGYLLPAKRVKNKEVQAVSMSLCRPINFYRQKRVLHYDEASGKAFMTEKSWLSTFRVLANLFKITCISVFSFYHAMKKFRNDSRDLMNEEFWERYLEN